jgi:hypothetical protein
VSSRHRESLRTYIGYRRMWATAQSSWRLGAVMTGVLGNVQSDCRGSYWLCLACSCVMSLPKFQTKCWHPGDYKVHFITCHEGTGGGGGIVIQLYSFFNLGPRWGGWLTLRPGHFNPRVARVPIVQEAGCAWRPVCTGAENVDPTGIWNAACNWY